MAATLSLSMNAKATVPACAPVRASKARAAPVRKVRATLAPLAAQSAAARRAVMLLAHQLLVRAVLRLNERCGTKIRTRSLTCLSLCPACAR